MPKRSSKAAVKQLAKSVLEQVSREAETQPGKNPAAVALGRMGGLKGGRARAESLSAKERRSIAQKAAKARWGNRSSKK